MLESVENIQFIDKRKGFWWARHDATEFLISNAAPGKMLQLLGFYAWLCQKCNNASAASAENFSLNTVSRDMGYGRNTLKELLWALHCLGLITWTNVKTSAANGGRLTQVETLDYDPKLSQERLEAMEQGWSDPDQPSDQGLVCTRPAFISNKSFSKNPPSPKKEPQDRRRGEVVLPPQISPQELQGAQGVYYPRFDPRHPAFINLRPGQADKLREEWVSKNGTYIPVPDFDTAKYIREHTGE